MSGIVRIDNLIRSTFRWAVLFSLPLFAHATAADMVSIPGGSYGIGADDGPGDARPAHVVRLAPCRIDVTEVTNKEFVRFLETLDVRVLRNTGAEPSDPKRTLPWATSATPASTGSMAFEESR